MRSDEQLEAYLHAVAEYEVLKREAGQTWQQAYLDLARARLSRPVSAQDHDPEERASTLVQDGQLVTGASTALAGVWPPETLRRSQRAFVRALELEVRCRAAQRRIDAIV